MTTGTGGPEDHRMDDRGTQDRGRVLLPLARQAIAAELGLPSPPPPGSTAYPWLREVGASFVTLHLDPEGRTPRPTLRGCIGTIEAYRPLGDDVTGNAVAAAFHDPRFLPLEAAEYPRLGVEVSVLSPREPLPFADRADLVARLRPGVDGLVLEHGGRRGTYLPQVWDQIPDPDDFLSSLVVKARLPQGFWSDDVAVSRYTVTAYEEER